LDDYIAKCDICGVPQRRSLLRYDSRGMTVCPSHGSGADSAELSEQNAIDAAAWADERAGAPPRDRPGEYGPENIVPDYGSGYFDYFDPSLPPKLLVDLDPSDTALISLSGSSVLAMMNAASGIAWTPPGAGQRPTYTSSWLNGNAAVTSDGSQYLLAMEPQVSEALEGSDRGFSVFAVLSLPAGDSDTLFGFAQSSLTTRFVDIGFDGSSRPRMQRQGNSGSALAATAAAGIDTSPHLVEWHYSGTALTVYVDGGAADPDAASCDVPYMNGDRCGLFCRPASTVAEILAATCGRLLVYAKAKDGPSMILDDAFIRSVREPLLERFGLG
jgi:hypothetical protein